MGGEKGLNPATSRGFFRLAQGTVQRRFRRPPFGIVRREMVLRSYLGHTPKLGERVFLAETAAVIGDVVLGDDVSIWYSAVVRGDCCHIRIGARSNVQDNCTLHVTRDTGPLVLEEEVTLGHNAVVHACTIRRGALIGMNATVLDDADVGRERARRGRRRRPPRDGRSRRRRSGPGTPRRRSAT